MHERRTPQTYVVRQLQSWDDKGWAVIAVPAGAIVVRNERLIMKLTKAEADRIAAELGAEPPAGEKR